VASRKSVFRIHPKIDLKEASFYRVAAVGRHGVRLSEVRTGEIVVVIGQGMIGQMSAQAARGRGARVIASDVLPERLEISAKTSADLVVNARRESLFQVVSREIGGAGADVVIDTTGINTMFGQALQLIRREGRICLQGYYPDPITVDFHDTHMMRAKVLFPCGWDADDDANLFADLTNGTLRIAPLITHTLRPHEAAERYPRIVDNPSASLGLILDWTETRA
jgi:2-desacetyl-2-hydroxyethyl bacteriochlorophyllide A dehydrogenase